MFWAKKKKLPEFGTVSCATCKWCGERDSLPEKGFSEDERDIYRWCSNPQTFNWEEEFSPYTGQLIRTPFKRSIKKINGDGNCPHWEAKDA